MNNKQFIWLAASGVVVSAFVFSFLLFRTPKNLGSNTADSMLQNQENAIIAQPPVEVIDTQTGEVDHAKFERVQVVTEDTTLNAIENELGGTIILEEDFSDL